MPEFSRTAPVTLVATVPNGVLELIAEERASAVVDVQPYSGSPRSREQAERTRVELTGDTLLIAVPRENGRLLRFSPGGVRVLARVPLDSTARIKLASADLRCDGRLAGLAVTTASGDIAVEHVTGDTEIETASGEVRLSRADQELTVRCSSGNVTVRQVGGPARVRTASGDVSIAAAGDGVRINSASGDIQLDQVERGTVHVESTSGDVGVAVRRGSRVWLDLATVSGTTRNGLDMPAVDRPAETAPDLTLQVRTVSGDITVRRAEGEGAVQ